MKRCLAVALAAVLVLSGCGDGSSSSPGPPAPQVVDAPFRCPAPTRLTQPGATDTGSDSLPSGATAARLCAAGWHAEDLRSGLDHLVSVVNAQRAVDPRSDTGCGQGRVSAWTIVLRYEGGTRTISADDQSCAHLRVGAARRFGDAHVYDAYVQALLHQRHQQGPPRTAPPSPRCPRHAVPVSRIDQDLPVADPTDAARAVVCVLTPRGARTIAMPRSALAALRHDLTTARIRPTDVDPPADCPSLAPSADVMVNGVDTWGDRFSVSFECDVYRLLPVGTDRYLFVRLRPATARILRGLIAG